VPGAVEALNQAAKFGFQVFYISNRECPTATAPQAFPHPDRPARQNTMAVLKRLGLTVFCAHVTRRGAHRIVRHHRLGRGSAFASLHPVPKAEDGACLGE